MKSSTSIWHLLQSVKSTVKISSIFVAFLKNMNFNINFKYLDEMAKYVRYAHFFLAMMARLRYVHC